MQEWPSRQPSSDELVEEDSGTLAGAGADGDHVPTSSAPPAARMRWPCEYAKVREQYGATIGSYQAVAHLLAESLALIEGSISVVRHAAWAVDELPVAEAIEAARVAKIYCARAAHDGL